MDKINKLKEILRATKDAYKALAKNFSHEKNTDELFLVFENSLKDALGSYEIAYDYIWGKDTLNIDGVTKKYYPQTGDTLIMDISVGKDGVWCDVCRTFFVGEPTAEQCAVYELVKASLRAGHKALKLGAKASDIYKAVNTVYVLNGKTLVHHAGHKIGEKPLMQPQFLEENDTPIVAGEVYTIESGLYENFGIRLENDFLVMNDEANDLFEELLPLDIEEYVLK